MCGPVENPDCGVGWQSDQAANCAYILGDKAKNEVQLLNYIFLLPSQLCTVGCGVTTDNDVQYLKYLGSGVVGYSWTGKVQDYHK